MLIKTTPPNMSASKFNRTTDEFASALRTKAQTIRKRYCLHGSYFGIRPLRLPNGKLLWPDATLENLICEQFGNVGVAGSGHSKDAHTLPEVDKFASAVERNAIGLKGPV
ncbi:MAG: hypothetical protein ACT6UH_09040 [Hydrogenophaga sp.]|uniref:hypothetical protein n=1 Tax=Hydrogenophaga sp. TaxID=1904254 RepID=UPI0040375125